MRTFSPRRFAATQRKLILSSSILTIREAQGAIVPMQRGKRIICKHLVATYFAALPQVAENFYENVVKPQEEEERLEEEIYDKVCDFVDNLSEDDLKSALLRLLFDGPDWQYEKFVVENGLYDYY